VGENKREMFFFFFVVCAGGRVAVLAFFGAFSPPGFVFFLFVLVFFCVFGFFSVLLFLAIHPYLLLK